MAVLQSFPKSRKAVVDQGLHQHATTQKIEKTVKNKASAD